jgi:hypothetical protein
MRNLTNIELQTVSGARAAPAPVPRVPTSIFGVKLSRGDRKLLAAIITAISRPVAK